MNTFNVVSKSRKILDRTIGVFLILMGIAIGFYLIPDLIPLIKRTPYQLLHPKIGVRNALGLDWFWQSIGWIIAFFLFRSGRAFLRDSKKPSSTSK
jgi:hypothetical protein|nr:hypothetical protein [Allomuricauda sp.]